MEIATGLTDAAVLAEIGRRIAERRIDAGLTQAAVAIQAGVAKRTVERVERGESAQLATHIRILRVLRLFEGLDALVPQLPVSPIALLQQQGKPRLRASARTGRQCAGAPWKWRE
jgi:transcriptional regulator with XRE-family HTH domain